MAIESVLDSETGRVKTYRSRPEQLAKLLWDVERLAESGADPQQLAKARRDAEKLRRQGVVPSAGMLVFKQIDADRSGTVDRAELKALLAKLPNSWKEITPLA